MGLTVPQTFWREIHRRADELPQESRISFHRMVLLDEAVRILHLLHHPCRHAGEPGHLASAIPPSFTERVDAVLEQYVRLASDEVAQLTAQGQALEARLATLRAESAEIQGEADDLG